MPDGSPRIMVVDDLVDHRELLSQVLVDLGYAVDTVGDAHTALDAIRRGPRPHLVLVDFWMPGMGGNQFLALLRADADPGLSSIPVVVMTADPDGVAGMLAPAPPDFLLEKPFGLRELRRVVVRFCGQGSGTRRWGGPTTHGPE